MQCGKSHQRREFSCRSPAGYNDGVEQSSPAPLPVIPIKRARRVDLSALLVIVIAGVVWTVYLMIHPSILRLSDGTTTTYRVNPHQINQQSVIMTIACACSVALVIFGRPKSRLRKYGGAGLVLALAVALLLWHQAVGRIIVTPDSLTAPQKSRLFPGKPVTVRFDEMAMLQFHSGNTKSRAGTRQTCYKKDRSEMDFDFGLLGDQAADQVAGYARENGVKVILPR